MRPLLPPPDRDAYPDVDAFSAVDDERRDPPPHRPWVMVNMVTSLDGQVTGREGRSGSLGGPPDRRMFQALRARADLVLAGANTVRIENYGAPRLPSAVRAARVNAGRPPLPRLAVVSASLDLPHDLRFFTEAPPDQPPVVLTSAAAHRAAGPQGDAIAPHCTVVEAGTHRLDWDLALRALAAELEVRILLVEGGPNVNAQLIAADLVDELCLTLSPTIVGGTGSSLTDGLPPLVPSRPFALTRALEEDGFLMLRYLRAAPNTGEEKTSDPAS